MSETWPSGDPTGCARGAADVKTLAWLCVAVPYAVADQVYQEFKAALRRWRR